MRVAKAVELMSLMSKKKLRPVDTPFPEWPLALQSEWRDAIEELHSERDRGVAFFGTVPSDSGRRGCIAWVHSRCGREWRRLWIRR